VPRENTDADRNWDQGERATASAHLACKFWGCRCRRAIRFLFLVENHSRQ